jgi:hypothetical protein
MKPQLILDQSREQYDAIKADHFSKLKLIAKSPAHYKYGTESEREDTDALRFGRAAHLWLLEPAAYPDRVAVWREGRRSGKTWDAFRAANEGRDIITEDEETTLHAMSAAVDACGYARPYLSGGDAEVSLLWGAEVVPGHVMPVKGRLDYVTKNDLVDVKFVRCASPAAFGRQAWDLQYLAQAAFYSDGYEKASGRRLPFVFVAIEKEPPHCIGVYVVTEEQLAAGRAEYERWLATLSLCRLQNDWPGYVTGPTPLVLPPWAEKQAQELFTAGFAEGVAQ